MRRHNVACSSGHRRIMFFFVIPDTRIVASKQAGLTDNGQLLKVW